MNKEDKTNIIKRIIANEERLNKLKISIDTLDEALNNFQKNQKDLILLNKYYGSKNWFTDKKMFENSKIPKVEAGVLSEDAIWNINENISDIIDEMKNIIVEYDKTKKD